MASTVFTNDHRGCLGVSHMKMAMAKVKSCFGKEGCPGKNFGRQPQPSSSDPFGGDFYDCTEIMSNNMVRLHWTNSTRRYSTRCEHRLQLGPFKLCSGSELIFGIFYEERLIHSMEAESVRFSGGQEHYYDQFLYASFCMEDGAASVTATRRSFNQLAAATQNFSSIWNYHYDQNESRVLHQAAYAFVNFNDSTPAPDLFNASGWPGCQAIIDNGIAGIEVSQAEGQLKDCKQTCARNFQWNDVGHLHIPHIAVFMGIPMVWPWWTLLNVALRLVLSAAFLFFMSKWYDAFWDNMKGWKFFWIGIVPLILLDCIFILCAFDFIFQPIFFIANFVLLMWHVASGHHTAWVCIKAILFYDQFNTHWQYLAGALGLFISTCLGYFCMEVSTPQADAESDEAETKEASRAFSAFRSLLIGECFCVICPCASIVVADLMQVFGWGWPLLSSLPWWVVPVLTFVFGLVCFVLMQCIFFGNGLGDIQSAIEAVPGKMLIFDIFMDISQIAGFYLLGQPYFALMQFTGLLSNAFMSSVVPRMKALEKPNHEELMLILMIGAGFFMFGMMIWSDKVMDWKGWLLMVAILVMVTAILMMVLPLLGQIAKLLFLNWRSFFFSLFQADVFMSVWESYKRKLETHELLLKKLAEACGEGSLSLYLGLTAIFKARLAEGQSFALFQIFGNTLLTVFCMADGMASALELTAAEGLRIHTVTVTNPKSEPNLTHELQGSLIQKDCPKSRLAFKSVRSVHLVVAFRVAEIMSMSIPLCLFAAAYGFQRTAVIYFSVGGVFMLVIGLVQRWISGTLFLLFLPSQSPATIPTIGHFEVEVAGRLAAAFAAWSFMAVDFFVVKVDFHNYMEEIRKSSSHIQSNSTFWQAYIIMTAAILGPIAWLAWAFLFYKLRQKRVQWIKEDTARLVALASEEPSMWCSGTKPNGLPALHSLPVYKASLAEVSTCAGSRCNAYTMDFVEKKETFQCSQCHETQDSPYWFCDKHQTRWCMACSPPPCDCSECSAEKPAVRAHSHRLALHLQLDSGDCDKCSRICTEGWYHGNYVVCFDCIPVKGPAGFLPKSDPPEATEAKPRPMPPIYPEYQQQAFIPLAGFGGGGGGEFAVGMPKERWASLLKTCPRILPPKVSESLLGCKHFDSFKTFAGFRKGCFYEFKAFKIRTIHDVSAPEKLETLVMGVGCKEKSQVLVGGWWSATSEMTWTFLAEDATIEIGLSWVQPTSKDRGQLVGKGVIFHEIEANDMDPPDFPDCLQNQLIYIPTGGHLLQSQALQVGRHQAELPEEHQVFEVSVAELPSSVWGESASDWQMVRFKPKEEEQRLRHPPWLLSCLQKFLKMNGCAFYSSVPQDEESEAIHCKGQTGPAAGSQRELARYGCQRPPLLR